VNIPARTPAAPRIDSTIAATEPLPFVPPTSNER